MAICTVTVHWTGNLKYFDKKYKLDSATNPKNINSTLVVALTSPYFPLWSSPSPNNHYKWLNIVSGDLTTIMWQPDLYKMQRNVEKTFEKISYYMLL